MWWGVVRLGMVGSGLVWCVLVRLGEVVSGEARTAERFSPLFLKRIENNVKFNIRYGRVRWGGVWFIQVW
jgi:hypothetical protein